MDDINLSVIKDDIPSDIIGNVDENYAVFFRIK